MTSSAGLQANTRRFELYVRISLYVLLAFEPLVVLGAFAPEGDPVPVVLALAHTVANVFACRWALTSIRTGPTLRRWDRIGLIGWAVLSLATLVVIVVNLDLQAASGSGTLIVPAGATLAAIAPALRPRFVLLAGVAGAVLTAATAYVAGVVDLPTAAGVAVGLTLSLTAFGFTFWLSGWMLAVVWELDAARTSAAELAIAEERLRIARDLHDLYGRTLATVAVKSELAAELIRRGRPEVAADEIAAVRVIADQSGRDMRQLVRGYREADLAAELSGARALLDSAGIRCVVSGVVPVDLASETASSLGWMLRESITNVIRHSSAKECIISVVSGSELRLTITNDGAGQPEAAGSPGSGLLGMGERLTAVGGHLEHWSAGDRFTVEAVVPARQPAGSGPR